MTTIRTIREVLYPYLIPDLNNMVCEYVDDSQHQSMLRELTDRAIKKYHMDLFYIIIKYGVKPSGYYCINNRLESIENFENVWGKKLNDSKIQKTNVLNELHLRFCSQNRKDVFDCMAVLYKETDAYEQVNTIHSYYDQYEDLLSEQGIDTNDIIIKFGLIARFYAWIDGKPMDFIEIHDRKNLWEFFDDDKCNLMWWYSTKN